MGYRIVRKDELCHKGIKGMKWGYNDGEPNGKRIAGDSEEEEYDGWLDETFTTRSTRDGSIISQTTRKGKISRGLETANEAITRWVSKGKAAVDAFIASTNPKATSHSRTTTAWMQDDKDK